MFDSVTTLKKIDMREAQSCLAGLVRDSFFIYFASLDMTFTVDWACISNMYLVKTRSRYIFDIHAQSTVKVISE